MVRWLCPVFQGRDRMRLLAAGVALIAALLSAIPATADDRAFPYDSELIMDVAPMRGSKRIPNMDVAANGAIAMEMWCNRIDGQFVVAADTVTVLTGQATQRDCPPDRVQGDERLLAALNQVTNWRRRGDLLELIGPQTLRFRVPTN